MANYSERVTETTSRAGCITNSGAAASYLSDAIPLAQVRRLVADIVVPTISNSATVNAYILWSSTSGGTYSTVTGTTLTQDTTGAHWNYIETTAEYIQSLFSAATYCKLQLVIGVSACSATATVRGYNLRYQGGTDTATAATGSSTLQTNP
jgi:hypothetical protein